MAFLVTVKINVRLFQTQESFAFISLPLSLTSKSRDLLGASSANPPGYQTLLSGREDAQHFSLSFRLALVGTGSSTQSSAAPSYSLNMAPLTSPSFPSHLVNKENFRDHSESQQATDDPLNKNGKRWFYL